MVLAIKAAGALGLADRILTVPSTAIAATVVEIALNMSSLYAYSELLIY